MDNEIEQLNRTTVVKPDHEGALVYLNLRYRRKADIVATAAARESFISQATIS